jgi:hypothetical protein
MCESFFVQRIQFTREPSEQRKALRDVRQLNKRELGETRLGVDDALFDGPSNASGREALRHEMTSITSVARIGSLPDGTHSIHYCRLLEHTTMEHGHAIR